MLLAVRELLVDFHGSKIRVQVRDQAFVLRPLEDRRAGDGRGVLHGHPVGRALLRRGADDLGCLCGPFLTRRGGRLN